MATSSEHPTPPDQIAHKGRAALSNRDSRFSQLHREADPDPTDEPQPQPGSAPRTQVRIEFVRSILSTNRSPDLPFDRSINPYRGCEHGCIYCYARPSHAYLGLSPGLDFETKLTAKTNAAQALIRELSQPGYRPAFIALGANTDPYQPIERNFQVTRSVLQVLSDCHHPVAVTTKSALVVRDIDLLASMAARNLVQVLVSIATLDGELARALEPRANAPGRRLDAVGRLARAGIPVGVLVAPIIPALTDESIERVLQAASEAGACTAGYTMLRLPLEVRDLFVEWLRTHYPQRADRVMSLVRQMRDGRDNDPAFGSRMRGSGPYAELISQRFKLARRRFGLDQPRPALDSSRFQPPQTASAQMSLL
jgi:DNA repair photolyase